MGNNRQMSKEDINVLSSCVDLMHSLNDNVVNVYYKDGNTTFKDENGYWHIIDDDGVEVARKIKAKLVYFNDSDSKWYYANKKNTAKEVKLLKK